MVAFTICSNNYLAQAIILAKTFKLYNNNSEFYIVIVDEKSQSIDYTKLPAPYLFIKDLEKDIDQLINKYDIIELNTCVKPAVFEYFLKTTTHKEIIYFDPDIKIFSAVEGILYSLFEQYEILLTPHIYTPIPLDNKTPSESNFLNYGLYNLGFIGIKKTNSSMAFLGWWKERTYKQGYKKVEEGIFVDQLYINFAPFFFDNVYTINDIGLNMAPWNLHERSLVKNDENIFIVNNKSVLKFFHFSSFILNSNELPTHYYNRYSLSERIDLIEIYTDYNKDLIEADYSFFKAVECTYSKQHDLYKRSETEKEKLQFFTTSFKRKIFINISKIIPVKLISRLQKFLSFYLKYN